MIFNYCPFCWSKLKGQDNFGFEPVKFFCPNYLQTCPSFFRIWFGTKFIKFDFYLPQLDTDIEFAISDKLEGPRISAWHFPSSYEILYREHSYFILNELEDKIKTILTFN